MESPESQLVKNEERRREEIEDDLEWFNSQFFKKASVGTSELTQPVLNKVMQALSDSNTHIIGVYGSNAKTKGTLLRRLHRRIARDKLFNVVLTASAATVSEKGFCCFWAQGKKKADINKIQDDIAGQLRLIFNHKSKHKRSSELCDRIKKEQKVLIIVRDLNKGLDLEKLGIPFGATHSGCKILLTSSNEDVLSNQMHTHKNFDI